MARSLFLLYCNQQREFLAVRVIADVPTAGAWLSVSIFGYDCESWFVSNLCSTQPRTLCAWQHRKYVTGGHLTKFGDDFRKLLVIRRELNNLKINRQIKDKYKRAKIKIWKKTNSWIHLMSTNYIPYRQFRWPFKLSLVVPFSNFGA